MVTPLYGTVSSVTAGLMGTSQAKVMAAGQAGLVPAQFIVQQAPVPNSSQAATHGQPLDFFFFFYGRVGRGDG